MAPPAPSDWADRLSDAVREHESTRRARRPALARYELGELLGRGGMGLVYRAFDTHLGRDVALKVLSDAAAGDPEAQARFLREAQLAARLRHPHITQVYDAGEHEGRVYIALELVPGGTLRDARPGLRDAVRALRDAARAVHYAHEQGVIHRDLKPANLLLDRAGRVFVTDFGLARRSDAAGTLTLSGTIMGTPVYMSPEQARGHVLDPRSDVYSLGAAAYEILSGRPPFEGANELQILKSVCLDEPPPPRRHAPSIPADLEAVVLKAMDKNPSGRYATAAELADDLERWLDGLPVRARARGTFYRARKKLVRHRWRVLAATSSALLAGAVAFFILSRPDPWEREFHRLLADNDLGGACRLVDRAAVEDPSYPRLGWMRRRLEDRRQAVLLQAFRRLELALIAQDLEQMDDVLRTIASLEGGPGGQEGRRALAQIRATDELLDRIVGLEQDAETRLAESRWLDGWEALAQLKALRPPDGVPEGVRRRHLEAARKNATAREQKLAADLKASLLDWMREKRDAYPGALLQLLGRIDAGEHEKVVAAMDPLRSARHRAEHPGLSTAELLDNLARMESEWPESALTLEVAARWAGRVAEERDTLATDRRTARVRQEAARALSARSRAGLKALASRVDPPNPSWLRELEAWLTGVLAALRSGDPEPPRPAALEDPVLAAAAGGLRRDLEIAAGRRNARDAASRLREACARRELDRAREAARALEAAAGAYPEERRLFEALEADAEAVRRALSRLESALPGRPASGLQEELARIEAAMPRSEALTTHVGRLRTRMGFARAAQDVEAAALSGDVPRLEQAVPVALDDRFREVPERTGLVRPLLLFASARLDAGGAADVDRVLTLALKEGLDDPGLLHRRGQARWRLDRPKEALKDWDSALSRMDVPSVERAILLRRTGRLDEAESDARAQRATDRDAPLVLAQVLYLRHAGARSPLPPEARAGLEEAERILADVQGPAAACWRGMAASRLGKHEAAREAFEAAGSGGRTDAWLRLGFQLLSQPKPPEEMRVYAERALDGAGRLSEDEAIALGVEAEHLPWSEAARRVKRDALSLRAYSRAARQFQAALEDAQLALELDSQAWLALLASAHARLQLGQRIRALKDLRAALPSSPDTWKPLIMDLIRKNE